jgi:cell division protein FtsI/penicillin-binding protein 2
MKIFKILSLVFLALFVASSIYFINAPFRLARLESYFVMYMDKLGFDVSDYEFKSYKLFNKNNEHPKNSKFTIPKWNIYLKDGTILTNTQDFYKLMVFKDISAKDLASLQKELDFINIDIQKLLRDTNDKYITLSYTLNLEEAKRVYSIVSKYPNYKKDGKYYKPMIAQLSGFKRIYTKDDFLSPFIGDAKKVEDENNITRIKGVEGIEGYYDKELFAKRIVLNIDLNKQIALQNEVDTLKKDLDKDEVSSIVLDLDSGYVNSIASSNRLNPNKNVDSKYSSYLNPNMIQYLFDIDFLAKPINEAMQKANVKQDDFGLLSKSNIDINFERNSFIKDGILKVNFMQVIKAYSTFYNNGIIKDFKIANQQTITQKQIIDKTLANEIKNSLEEFYKRIEDKKIILEFKEHKKTASIKIKYIEEDNKRYLKAYFIVDKSIKENE